MQLNTGNHLRLTIAGYLFITLAVIFGTINAISAFSGFTDSEPDLSPWGFLGLVWLMVFVFIIGRIILKMRGSATNEVEKAPAAGTGRITAVAVPQQYMARFVGWLFFGVGSTFAWLAIAWLQNDEDYGRILILGIIFSVLGGIVLFVTYRSIQRAKKLATTTDEAKRAQLAGESKPLAMLGLIVAGLVLFVFYALGIIAFLHNPERPAGAIVFLTIPTIGILIFLFVRSRIKARNRN